MFNLYKVLLRRKFVDLKIENYIFFIFKLSSYQIFKLLSFSNYKFFKLKNVFKLKNYFCRKCKGSRRLPELKTTNMDAGPSYSYQHDLKIANLVAGKGKQMCLVHLCQLLLCTSIS